VHGSHGGGDDDAEDQKRTERTQNDGHGDERQVR